MPVFGPYGNDNMPSTSEFLQELFGVKNGAFKYLSDMLDKNQDSAYKLIAHDIQDKKQTQLIYQQNGLSISAQQVIHGPIPAFAYIIQYCGKTLVFSGDTNSQGFENLQLKKTDLFIAHNAIPEDAGEIAKFLHMTPTQIGKVAKHLNTQKLILSHRMKRTLGKEQQTLKLIKQNYQGATQFADDLDVIKADN
jgi:ribonuclease BN (tRNA processing enzyme)